MLVIICIVILLIFICYYLCRISDFGESSLNMNEDEYNEFCKEYQKEWESMKQLQVEHEISYMTDDLTIPDNPTKTGHCEECKHFRKLPYHADTLGKCFQHTGFYPKGDWYCADYEPQERSDKE